ncbi:MAG: hypothetical protein AAF468_21845 [Pseudomonadota bacterium]
MPAKIKHISWKNGRPRFNPGKSLIALGYSSRMLKHEDGRPYTAGEALDFSNRISAEVAAKRTTKTVKRRNRKGAVRQSLLYTVGDMFDDWFTNNQLFNQGGAKGHHSGLSKSPATVRDYRQKSRVIEQACPLIWQSDISALDEISVHGMFEQLWKERGLSTARGCVRTLSAAITWARKRRATGLLTNPCYRLQLPSPAHAPRFATKHEIRHLIATADHLGLPFIGDMISLGVWTGQRQSDRLALTHKGKHNGRRFFRQSKTGAIVAIKQAPELEARLAAAIERRKKKADGKLDQISAHAVTDEQLDKALSGDRCRKLFARVRKAAIEGIEDPDAQPDRTGKNEPVWIIQPCASLANFKEKDLRATAVTWMANASATIPEICAVTGHTPASAVNILRHYLAQNPELADSALDKMINWFEEDGDIESWF